MKIIKPRVDLSRGRRDYITNNKPNFPGIPYELYHFAHRIERDTEAGGIATVMSAVGREMVIHVVDSQD